MMLRRPNSCAETIEHPGLWLEGVLLGREGRRCNVRRSPLQREKVRIVQHIYETVANREDARIPMGRMKGPGIFLAQFLRDKEPYNNLSSIGRWAAGLGYKGIQIPAWDSRAIDLNLAAQSKTYCDEYKGRLREMRLEPT